MSPLREGPSSAALLGEPDLPKRRFWFKREMAEAILEGRKTETTRDHQKGLGSWVAVTGSYYDATPFAVIKVVANPPTTWARQVGRWREEGFTSRNDMAAWCKREGLDRYALAPALWVHEFTLTRRLVERLL